MKTKQDIKKKILKAGLKLFAKKGFNGTAVNDIIRKAKISPPMLYYHFKGKDEIFNALIKDGLAILNEMLEESLQKEHFTFKKIVAFINAHIEFAIKHPEYTKILLDISATSENPDFTPIPFTNRTTLETIIKEGVEKGEISSTKWMTLSKIIMGTVQTQIMELFRMQKDMIKDRMSYIQNKFAENVCAILTSGVKI